MSDSHSLKVIIAAAAANCGIAIVKGIGFLFTGSSVLLAEAVHSLADTTNQFLLIVGKKKSEKSPDSVHQFGYGRSRYFFSFLVAQVIFTLGAVCSLVEGIEKITHPAPIDHPQLAVGIIMISLLLESYSLYTAWCESTQLRGKDSVWRFIRRTPSPELPVVMLEDLGALAGLLIAGVSIVFGWAAHNVYADGIGTIAIGVLLAGIAIILMMEMYSLLIGEGVHPDDLARLEALIVQAPIERVIHIRTEYISSEELLIAVKIAFPATLTLAEVSGSIDAAEARIREVFPQARYIFVEPDQDNQTVFSTASI